MNITYWNRFSLTVQLPAHTVAMSFHQRELDTSGSSFGEAKSQKWKRRGAAAECHKVSGVQSHWARAVCVSLVPMETPGLQGLGAVTLLSPRGHRWQEDEAQLAGRALQGSQVRETAEPRQSHTMTWWKWPKTANSSAPELCNLLIPLTNNSLLSLDGEATAVSARAWAKATSCPWVFFSLVTLMYWWHWDRWPAASGVPLLGMCYMKMVLDW